MAFSQKGESKTFAVGHLALGYILGKTSAHFMKTKLNVPIVLTLSIIPDIDILVPFLQHRGPAHSIIVLFMVFVPIFAIYRKKAIPYFLALIQHPLVGDYIAGGPLQLLWPLTTRYYGMEVNITSPITITMEWIVFLASIIIMLKTRDITTFFQPHNSNLILIIPTFTVLLPTFLAFPITVPSTLILPHIVYLILFLTPILIDARKILTNSACKPYTKARTINNT
jgi:hypothetical protein